MVEIVKASGEKETFSTKKLLRSLRRSGATPEVASRIAEEVEHSLTEGTKTKEIYRKAFHLLRQKETLPVAHKYNLRGAIMELGPDGFTFERFVGEIFKKLGHEVTVGVIMDGWCVEHEVDVSARMNGTHALIECKFHNTAGYKTDLQVALYVRERFQDIEKKHEHENPTGSRCHEGWLFTNTKLTTKAIQYSQCVGLNVVGWGYPSKGHGNLEDLIEKSGVHPVTLLTTLSKHQKRQLMQNGVIVCGAVHDEPDLLRKIGIGEEHIPSILEEIRMLSGIRDF